MKKLLSILFVLMLTGVAFAQNNPSTRVVSAVEKEIVRQQSDILFLARNGEVKFLHEALSQADETTLRARDKYGNNILHLARNKQVFGLIWNMLDEQTREDLLAQRNKSGETPFMAHIMYGHEDIFLSYFPRSHLYKQLQSTTESLNNSGTDYHVGEIKQAGLTKLCSMGGQTMWQRAHSLYQGAMLDSHYAQYRAPMKQVEEMLAEVAPFLVK
ncbi:MAG: hypothetical protein J6U96_03390 [Elusimicrobiaceae bacterium]|nr:hypothetical protein [Elusimicrobiaceae bacterium]